MPRRGQFKMRVNCICEKCNSHFEVKRSDYERRPCKFCSPKCSNSGLTHPRWIGGRTIRRGYVAVKAPGHPRANSGGYVFEHILIAERALGKPLPVNVPVHHHDMDGTNNANANLVICNSGGYHRILHQRMKVIAVGGDPNTQAICARCKAVKLLDEFYPNVNSARTGRSNYCKECAKGMTNLWAATHRTR